MNKEEIHEKFFEDLHKSQMNTINNEMIKNNSKINNSIIDDARKVILKLILYMNTTDKGANAEKDEAVLDALKWIKNNAS